MDFLWICCALERASLACPASPSKSLIVAHLVHPATERSLFTVASPSSPSCPSTQSSSHTVTYRYLHSPPPSHLSHTPHATVTPTTTRQPNHPTSASAPVTSPPAKPAKPEGANGLQHGISSKYRKHRSGTLTNKETPTRSAVSARHPHERGTYVLCTAAPRRIDMLD